jgi:hypothetical protein
LAEFTVAVRGVQPSAALSAASSFTSTSPVDRAVHTGAYNAPLNVKRKRRTPTVGAKLGFENPKNGILQAAPFKPERNSSVITAS